MASRWLASVVPALLAWCIANVLVVILVPLGMLYEALGGASARARLGRMTALSARIFFVRFLPFVHFYRLTTQLPSLPSGPVLVVANHRSWLDALLLIGLMPGLLIPVSARYTRLPIIGRLMRWLGCVPLNSGDPATTASSLKRLRQQLAQGAVVVGFPEGRRMLNGELGVFSDVFFRLAVDCCAPIYPVMIHCAPQLFGPSRTWHLSHSTPRFTLRLGAAIQTHPQDRPADLARRTRKWLNRELEPLDAGGQDP